MQTYNLNEIFHSVPTNKQFEVIKLEDIEVGDTIVHLFRNPHSSNIKAWWGVVEEIERDDNGKVFSSLTTSRTLYEREFDMEKPRVTSTDPEGGLVLSYDWHDDHENGHYLLRAI